MADIVAELPAIQTDTSDVLKVKFEDNGDGTWSLLTSQSASAGADSASVTSVADTTTSTELIAANSDRKELEITNTSSADLYVLKGSGTASGTNLTTVVSQNETYETTFQGAVQGVWASDPNAGSALITEST